MEQTLAERFATAYEEVQFAAQKVGRAPDSVQLLAVSKTQPIAAIEEIAALGHKDFGENYAQEAVEKAQQLAHLGLQWHFIGPIQSNKTRSLAEHMDWIHTVEREKIAQRLNDQRPQRLDPLKVCIQVNVSAEEQKSGVPAQRLFELAQQIDKLPNLQLKGLMAIVENTQDEQRLAQQFATMQQLFEQLQQGREQVDTLSMGMSQDMAQAIAHGSTLVRIGTAIFGPRRKR